MPHFGYFGAIVVLTNFLNLMLLVGLSNTETYSVEKIMVIYFSQFVFCAIDISKKVGNFENVFMFLTIFETQPFSGEQFTRLTSIQLNFARPFDEVLKLLHNEKTLNLSKCPDWMSPDLENGKILFKKLNFEEQLFSFLTAHGSQWRRLDEPKVI